MHRRQVIALIGVAAIAPVPFAHAQQPVRVIGYLGAGSLEGEASYLAEIRDGLKEAGYIEGQNVVIEYRWAEGRNDRLSALAAELVTRNVDVIITGAWPGTTAAKAATSTIPIVFVVGVDPVATGLVSNLARPEGNLTGFTVFGPQLSVKRFELLSELLPRAHAMVILINLTNPVTVKSIEQFGRLVEGAANAKGVAMHRVPAGNPAEIDAAFAALAEAKADGLLVGVDPLFYQCKDQIVALAARYRVPAIYDHRMYSDAGGLISYGVKAGGMVRPAGVYVGRILAGAKPADLPVQLPSKFELVINRKAANALGINVPPDLELQADEIIE